MIVDKLRGQQYRDSTKCNYYTIWKLFNKFFLRLDQKPGSWEERLVLFVGYLIDDKKQSSTVKSYVSAIKAVLKDVGVKLSNDLSLINSLTKACRLVNDQICTRLPIQKVLLEVLIKQISVPYDTQPYLKIIFKALLCTSYFGLLRVGELTAGEHPVLARDVHIATNKRKIMLILHTSKMHGKNMRPQTIKITSTQTQKQSELPTQVKEDTKRQSKQTKTCPYELLRDYLRIRGSYRSDMEPFFVFSDGSPVTPVQLRNCLKKVLCAAGFQHDLYSIHSLRMGRAYNLLKLGVSVETIKKLGHWRSNAVFRYLK